MAIKYWGGLEPTMHVAMIAKLLSSHCGAHLLESCCEESNISDTKWLRYLFYHLFRIRLSAKRNNVQTAFTKLDKTTHVVKNFD